MSFIQWLGEWLRKVSTSVKSITAGTNSLTYTRHNNDSVTIPLTLESDLYVKKTGDTVTGNINSLYGVDGVETVNQFSGEMAGDDLWAIRTGVTGHPDPEGAATGDNGYLEIATADNGTEPIYISQYIGDHILPDSQRQGERFYQLHRSATLLDEQGNTFFPGTVIAASFSGNATSATHANSATSAGTASKLGTSDVGSATQPIYLEGGVATACTYQLHKTVPADAVFTDTVYTHPTTSGNKHIPSGGSSGQILRWGADGTAVWGADTDTVYTHPTTSGNKHIPSGGSSGQILRWSADGTAAWGADNDVWSGYTLDINTNNTTDSWVPVFKNSIIQHRVIPADAKFTDTVTTVTSSGTGNAVTDITANNGQLSVTKGASFFPLNGGALTGTDIFRSEGNSRLFLSGGSAWNTGSQLWLQSKEVGDGITLTAMGNNGGTKSLFIKPDGTLSWDGKDISRLLTNTQSTGSRTSAVSSGAQLNYTIANNIVWLWIYVTLTSQAAGWSDTKICTNLPAPASRNHGNMCGAAVQYDKNYGNPAYFVINDSGELHLINRGTVIAANIAVWGFLSYPRGY